MQKILQGFPLNVLNHYQAQTDVFALPLQLKLYTLKKKEF